MLMKTSILLIILSSTVFAISKEEKTRLLDYGKQIKEKSIVGFKCTDKSGEYAIFRENLKFYHSGDQFYFYDKKGTTKLFNTKNCTSLGRAKF